MTAAERLLNHLHAGPRTAVVLHDPSNMFYLTEGYTGEGLVYLSEEQRVIITDFRYTEQAERQAPEFRVERGSPSAFSRVTGMSAMPREEPSRDHTAPDTEA